MYKIVPVEKDPMDLRNKNFNLKYTGGHVRVDGTMLAEGYTKFVDAIENFEVRDDDVWICTFPKTGSTWTQEMVWCIANDFDFERAKVPIADRFLFFEVCILVDFEKMRRDNPDIKIPVNEPDSINYIGKLSSPRFIRTHLPFHLLPRQIRTGDKSPKIISVIRNPKDTCVSYYHHSLLLNEYHGNLEDFCELFIADRLEYTPYWTHVLSYWKKRFQNNVLVLKFEDMKKDLPSEMRKTAKFLGKVLTYDQVSLLNEHLSFKNMKTNPAVNRESLVALHQVMTNKKQGGSFIRCGANGQWKMEMAPEIVKQFDFWIAKHQDGTDLSFS